jgi:putative aminopeptidase FrvX
MRFHWRSTLALLLLGALNRAGLLKAQATDSLAVRLAAMSAVTGFEDALAESLLAMLPGSGLDRAGNVVLAIGSGEPARAAICSMDEVGYVVGGISLDGYLTLRRVGSTNPGPLYDQFLEGHRVTVFGRRGPVPGVVGVRSTHLTRGRPPGGDQPFSLDSAFVDVGAATADHVAGLGIEVLSPVTRAKQPHRYGGRLLAAPNVSQRAACAALLAAALRARPAAGTAIVAFARRRHFGMDGAGFLLRDRPVPSDPAAVVVVGESAPGGGAAMGSGPQVSEAGMPGLAGRRVSHWTLPARYLRTPVETVSLDDVAALEARLLAFLGGAP